MFRPPTIIHCFGFIKFFLYDPPIMCHFYFVHYLIRKCTIGDLMTITRPHPGHTCLYDLPLGITICDGGSCSRCKHGFTFHDLSSSINPDFSLFNSKLLSDAVQFHLTFQFWANHRIKSTL
jgi:hypothetical protein